MVTYETSRKTELDRALKSFFGSRPSKLFNPITVLASPAWRGVEGDIWCAESENSSFIFKHYHEDTYFYVDKSAAILAAKEGGSLKVAPVVAMSWLESGIVVFESLKNNKNPKNNYGCYLLGTNKNIKFLRRRDSNT